MPDYQMPKLYQVDLRVDGENSVERQGFEIDAPWSYAGATVHWHTWGSASAFTLGVAREWTGLEGLDVGREHPAALHVQRVLLVACEGEALPSGIVALDLRGLPASCVHAVTTALVARVRSSAAPRKGVIVLGSCEAVTWIGRTIDLYVGE